MFIFLHLPKTAGTTLRSILSEVYGAAAVYWGYDFEYQPDLVAAFDQLSPSEQQQKTIIACHLDYGFHNQLFGDYRYITFFRDPVDRVLSTYYFMRGGHGLETHPLLRGREDMSLNEFVTSGITKQVDNGLVRLVSGTCRGRSVTSADLDLAKRNLREDFDVFGFSDVFDESMVLFGRKLGWDRVPLYRKENVTPKRPKVDEVPEGDRAVIERHCEFDIELYRYARELYDQEVTQLGNDFQREVRQYAAAIRDVRRIVDLERSEWQSQTLREVAKEQTPATLARRATSKLRSGVLAITSRFAVFPGT